MFLNRKKNCNSTESRLQRKIELEKKKQQKNHKAEILVMQKNEQAILKAEAKAYRKAVLAVA